MVLDFGGGNLGSWTKLCAVRNGVELKFGSASPPIINPFQLSSEDSFPNQQKKKLIAIALGLEDNAKTMLMIDAVYKYLRTDDSPFIDNDTRRQELISRCPAFSKFAYKECFDILKLGPGSSRPGEKGSASIKITLELLLADDVNENGPTNNVWASFAIDDITEAVMRLYENFRPPLSELHLWPTLTDFRNTLEVMQRIRKSGTSSNKWGQSEIFNFGLLMSRLTNYCVGEGYDAFLDGQTNVDILKKTLVNGIVRDMPAKFILADMAGISDKRKLALYMIVINDFMTNVLYNSKDTRGIMIRDEVWFFMRSKIAAPYLEADYRLARKYAFSVMSIAQQFTDFKNEVIKNNTQIWVVCNLGTTEQINAADVEFKFSGAERALFEQKLMGFKMERDNITGKVVDAYARIMIVNKSGKYFIKNKISRLERWITTTNPNETFVFNFIKEAKMRGKPVIDIIKWLCTEEYLKDRDVVAIVKKAKRKMPRM